MRTFDRLIGVGMVAIGFGLFAIAHMVEPYMDTLSGTVLYAVAIPTAITIAIPTAILVGYGAAQAAGWFRIKVVVEAE